ncbi:MAG: hypothetical protein AB9846_07770 [Tenuifilaceae bacterium]
MEKEKFYSYFDSSEILKSESSDFLKSLIEKYPFFHGAKILYIKSLKENNSPIFQEILQKNAGLIPDRRHLFYILYPSKPLSRSDDQAKNTEPKENITKNKNDNDASFVLIENINPNSDPLVDISDLSKELIIPVSEYDLLEISEQNDSVDNDITPNGAEGAKSKNDLIDQFIKTNPRIRPPQIIKDDQEDISLKSLSEPEDLITEPLAKIYLSQGLIDKAISIYEKLSLKFPEKSSYFAGQIQEIKKENNKT